jgi:hypothetical protein
MRTWRFSTRTWSVTMAVSCTVLLPALAMAAVAADDALFVPAPPAVPPAPPAVPAALPTAGGAPPPDGIELTGAGAGAVREPSRTDAWGGARSGSEATLSDRVANYRLRAVLDPDKHTIDGRETLAWRNRSAVPVTRIYMHLYLNAFESPGSTFMHEKEKFGHFRSGVEMKANEWGYMELRSVRQGGESGPAAAWSFVHPDGGPETDHTVVRVDLPEPVAPGGSTTLDIAFFDQLPRVIARTGYFDKFHLVGQWYPKVGVLELPGERGAKAPRWNAHEFHLNSEFYADWGSYDLEVVAPAGYTVGASGSRPSPPVQTPEGLAHRFHVDDVHDVAFTAWNGYAEWLTGTWTGPGSPRVNVEVLAPAEYASAAKEALDATVDSLGYFSRTLGPYPYDHVTVVVPPFNAEEAGGMEYETFFTTAGGRGFPFAGSGVTRFVTVHEFGHGYFMGLLASNEFEEPFLDEGMNELWDARMLSEGMHVPLPRPVSAFGLSLPDFTYWDIERTSGAQRHPMDPIAGNSWHRFSTGSYGTVYSRTVCVFHDLERLLGEETFARAMKLYYARWHFRHPSTADLEQAFIDAGGDREAVQGWFDGQVYGASAIDDRVESVEALEVVPQAGPEVRDGKRTVRDTHEIDEEIEKTRKAFVAQHGEPAPGKPGPYPFHNVVRARRYGAAVDQQILVAFEDGHTERVPWPARESWGEWTFDGPIKVASAQLDPNRDVLLDVNKLDDGRTREAHPSLARRLALDTAAFSQFALSLLETL